MNWKKIFSFENFDKSLKSFDKGMSHFNKAMQDFGDSMESMTKELGSDIEKSKVNQKERESINKANLDKIWGKRDE
jgi:hypothetical protein